MVLKRWFRIGRLSIKKEFKIRTRFEYGESLKDLSIKFKVPLRTLEERKKRSALKGDPWIKGFRKNIKYSDLISNSENKKEAILKEINDKARAEILACDQILEDFYSSKSVIGLPEVESAYLMRIGRIEKQLAIRKLVEDIIPEEAQISIELMKAQLEYKKLEVKLKVNELENKELDLDQRKKEIKLIEEMTK